jgi:hypothetical protein
MDKHIQTYVKALAMAQYFSKNFIMCLEYFIPMMVKETKQILRTTKKIFAYALISYCQVVNQQNIRH